MSNPPTTSLKGELTEEQAYQRAVELYKVFGKNVDGQRLKIDLVGDIDRRYWRVYPQGEGTVSILAFNSKTGSLIDFIDKDPVNPKPKRKPTRLSHSELESKVNRLLKQVGFEQKLTRPRFVGEATKDDVYAEIYEVHNGLPVRDNVIEIGLLARGGSIFYAGAGFHALDFAGAVKVEASVAKSKAQAEREPNRKPREFGLWYARLPRSKDSEVARPYYIATYDRSDEVWIDAETGKVAHNERRRQRATK